MTNSLLPVTLKKTITVLAVVGNLCAFGQTVQKALPNLKGFDCDVPLDSLRAISFKDGGYSFCLRYLSLTDLQDGGDLSSAEVSIILNAGLALSAVQHAPDHGWTPTAQLGKEYGTNAAANAASIGLSQGMNLWCDLEEIAPDTPPQVIIDYCNAWYDAVLAGNYVPGLYVGGGSILDGIQLYNLKFKHYWKSVSTVPDIPYRGYQMIQQVENKSAFGIGIDIDYTQNDKQGNAVLWLKI